MNAADFFAERRARADFEAFDRLMRRKAGEKPRPEDTIPRLRKNGRPKGVTRAADAARPRSRDARPGLRLTGGPVKPGHDK